MANEESRPMGMNERLLFTNDGLAERRFCHLDRWIPGVFMAPAASKYNHQLLERWLSMELQSHWFLFDDCDCYLVWQLEFLFVIVYEPVAM